MRHHHHLFPAVYDRIQSFLVTLDYETETLTGVLEQIFASDHERKHSKLMVKGGHGKLMVRGGNRKLIVRVGHPKLIVRVLTP